MEFHQLRYFAAAAELENMTRAAGRLHVSQPALSRQIRLLEEELGVPLFVRARQRVRLSEAGTFFRARALQLLADAEEAGREVRRRFAGEARVIHLGLITPFLDDLVAPVVREFRERHPETRVALHDLPPAMLLRKLAGRGLDFAVLGNIAEEQRAQFEVRTLSRHPMAAVLPAGHRLADRASIRLEELRREAWISLDEALFPGRRAMLAEAGRRAGFAPRVVFEADSLPLLLTSVAAGEGVGILPAHAAKLPHEGCRFVKISRPRLFSTLLLVRPRGAASPETGALVQSITARARTLSPQRGSQRPKR